MFYLLCVLLAAAAMILSIIGGKYNADSYGRRGILLDPCGGIRFQLPPVAVIGGANCDVDLSGCGYRVHPNQVLARITLDDDGRFILTGEVTVLRGSCPIACTEQGISLMHKDVILIPGQNPPIRLTFLRR